ncbi:putative disease resistance RPP13-like protein 1 [Abeliophyllum distichum]|uniref:Disease resistance RPP13-like protein 1 n=1 Tax=Abeliophyllum distichum TaxID=126358 RepID=A0ABD1PSZ3_9LAMI
MARQLRRALEPRADLTPPEAGSLASKLNKIQQLLEAAERKGVTDPQVKAWLGKIEDAAYEMDDALDEWEMKIHEQEMEGSEDVSDFWEKVSSFIQSLCLCFEHVIDRRGIALKIKELNGRLELIAKENDEEFKFLPKLSGEKNQDSQDFKRVLETSYVDKSKVKGRDDDQKILASKLLSESKQGNGIHIISIVGTGGLGKTTLAKLVFNDFKENQYFQQKIWICVSDPFDEIRIAKAILESLDQHHTSQNLTEFQALLQCIETTVSGKRFLLVLDDVWKHDDKKWEPLKICLSKGAPGSRILVTTRNESVAEMMGSVDPHLLQPLSDPECFALLSQIAFQKQKEPHNKLEAIGREIAQKCGGLPLAAKTLGSLLSFKKTDQEWRDVLNSEIWQLEIAEVEIFPHLYLSYNELQPAVKRCFSYCAIFPKDLEIDVNALIRMWMAQGFLSGETAEKMELKGREYVRDLAVRSFFQDIEEDGPSGHISSCKMHDIIHDFAQFLTKSECFIVDITDDEDITAKEAFCRNARHLSWEDHGRASSPRFNMLQELSPEIGNLIHLRYLDLSFNRRIRELPRTVCDLYYLQTLILDACDNLSKLPEEIYKLINLRHLVVGEMHDAASIPQGLEKLTGLRTLSCFKTARGGSRLGWLKNLNQLEGHMDIIIDNINEESNDDINDNMDIIIDNINEESDDNINDNMDIIIDNINDESDVIEAQNAALKNKNGIRSLHLEFRGEVRMDVMEALHPPPNLLGLSFYGYVGIEFPRWITTSLNNLKIVDIYHCSSLPPLGNLEFLEELSIWRMENMKYLGREFLGITGDGRAIAFPKLKCLRFYNCKEWTEWEDIREEEEKDVVSIMPCLRKLRVFECPNLKSLPHRLLSRTPLDELDITNSDLLIEQIRSRGGYEFLSPTCQVIY